ncbi:MAG: amidohydrolase family protein, partial [Bacillota bacterium]|nr:amidohydrolase family protein [Bacillota bacterium]
LSESVVEVQESYKEFGISPVQKLANLGVLSARTSAAHCVQLDENDLDLLAQHQVHVLYNPSSNLKLGNGFARIGEMIRRGINVAIGTDGSSSNNNVNMLEELHLAAMVNKGVDRDPTVLPAAEAIRMATLGGARALGLNEVGGLAAGYKADLILIDIDKPHLTPLGDPLSAVVYSAAGADVTDMLVDGRFLMRDSRILTFDEKEVMQKIREIAPRLLGTTE